jgi:hypothetical protein
MENVDNPVLRFASETFKELTKLVTDTPTSFTDLIPVETMIFSLW